MKTCIYIAPVKQKSSEALSLTIRVYYIHLTVVAFHICEIPQNSPKIRTYNSSRSPRVIDLGANRKRTCDFLLAISSNFGRISR